MLEVLGRGHLDAHSISQLKACRLVEQLLVAGRRAVCLATGTVSMGPIGLDVEVIVAKTQQPAPAPGQLFGSQLDRYGGWTRGDARRAEVGSQPGVNGDQRVAETLEVAAVWSRDDRHGSLGLPIAADGPG